LVTALRAARDAARSILDETGSYGAFDEAVEAGVSANLCHAVATLGTENAAAKVRVSVAWASSRPPTVEARPSAFRTSSPIAAQQARQDSNL
jgi:hypothetical protein